MSLILTAPLIYQPKRKTKCKRLAIDKALQKVLFLLGEIMYKTKKYGVVSCKTENQILAELERDFKKERKNKHESTRHKQDTKSDRR